MSSVNRQKNFARGWAEDPPELREALWRTVFSQLDLGSSFGDSPGVRPDRDNGPRKVTNPAERMLSRLRFDLHDGPQQDVIMLAEDLRMFREQLADVIADPGIRDRALGRVDDLEARLVALERDLRRISGSLLSPFLQGDALPDAIAQLAEAFATRTQIEPEIELRGDLTGLSESQQIALLAVTREALSNIREHSDADRVAIMLSNSNDGVHATVTDDGRGFDPDTVLARAGAGHLGLVGMRERVRLLGGRLDIDSRPGGPTVISVLLPPSPAVQARSARPGISISSV